ncbi:MAG TPA: calcium/proton exchanger [Gemmatimonadales bacterium]|nr:calcium/proton exchanger [Gemmatimonadales bacterium]
MAIELEQLLEEARAEATRLGHDFVGTEHILLALASSGDAGVEQAFGAAGLAAETVRRGLEQALRPGPHKGEGLERPLRSGARKVVDAVGSAPGDVPAALLTQLGRERRGPVAQVLGKSGGEKKPAPQEKELSIPNPRQPRQEKRGREGGRGERGDRPQRQSEPPRPEVRPATPPRQLPPRRNFRLRPVYLLFVAVPLSWVLVQMHAAPLAVFIAACLAVLPLAALMGEATEHLAHRTGPALGGLLNATFGNAAELIIAIVALQAGLVGLVKASITGSILGNLLLILGLSFIAGGMKRPVFKFNRATAGMSAAMLMLAVIGLVMPALFHSIHPELAFEGRALRLSEIVAIVLGLTYLASLWFSLRSHKALFVSEEHPVDGPVWGLWPSLGVLALATVGVAVESEILVHATQAVTDTLGLTPTFLGLIVIPIIGNAAEHASAVVLAGKGQTDVALQIALGSSTQVALFVAPVLVGVGLLVGQRMDLVFTPFEVLAVALSTLVVAIITLDGESHWFEGMQLLAVYGMIAAAAMVI